MAPLATPTANGPGKVVRRSASRAVAVCFRIAKRSLFLTGLGVSDDVFRLSKLVFHLLAVANLPRPIDNDPVVHI